MPAKKPAAEKETTEAEEVDVAIVDGEDLETAEAVKHENLEGPSEEELSKEREAEVAYVPPGASE